MESIQESIQLQSPSNTTAFRRSPYLRFVFILLAGFALANIGAIGFAQITRSTLPPPNPFLEYADIFPGQPISAVNARAFSCWSVNNYYQASDVTCSFTPESDVFSRVETTISNDFIHQTTFTPRENTLKAGNLILLFDVPNFRAYPRKVFFFWSNLFIIVSTTASGNPAAIRPVWSVTFTNRY